MFPIDTDIIFNKPIKTPDVISHYFKSIRPRYVSFAILDRAYLLVAGKEHQHGRDGLRQHGQQFVVQAIDVRDRPGLGQPATVQEL